MSSPRSPVETMVLFPHCTSNSSSNIYRSSSCLSFCSSNSSSVSSHIVHSLSPPTTTRRPPSLVEPLPLTPAPTCSRRIRRLFRNRWHLQPGRQPTTSVLIRRKVGGCDLHLKKQIVDYFSLALIFLIINNKTR